MKKLHELPIYNLVFHVGHVTSGVCLYILKMCNNVMSDCKQLQANIKITNSLMMTDKSKSNVERLGETIFFCDRLPVWAQFSILGLF